jgi:hypothetical protein
MGRLAFRRRRTRPRQGTRRDGVAAHQDAAGLDIVTDGEMFRTHFVHGFLEHIRGIDWEKKTPMGIRDNRYTVDVPTVTGPSPARIRCIWKRPASFGRRPVGSSSSRFPAR